MTDQPSDFEARWRTLTAAAKQVPRTPLPTLDVERILAARRDVSRDVSRDDNSNMPRSVHIGWFPPGLAAAALLACGVALLAGLDPRPALSAAGMFLSDLPAQVPHAPMVSPPVAVPSPSVLTDLMPSTSFTALTLSIFPETSP